MPLRSSLAAFVIAAFVSVVLTPWVRRLAFRLGAVSSPGGRHVHQQRTARLGGLAIFAGMLVPLVVLAFSRASVALTLRDHVSQALGLLVGGTLMCATGAVDDARGLGATRKLWLQIGAALVAYGFGFRIEAVSLPLVGDISMGIFAVPVTVAWIVGIINAVNLIDGLDGLAAGVVFFAGITNLVVAHFTGATFVALIMAAMLGAVVGFLIFNFNPARIFMGDSGSYFLGYVLATCSLAGAVQKASTAVSLLVPVLALGVPILDTLFALVRRFLERRPLFAPDRGHIHHRLLALGITHRRAVLIIYGVCVAFTVAALALALGHSWQAGLAILAVSVVLVALVRWVGWFEYLHTSRRQLARVRSRDTELLRYALPALPAALDVATTEAEVWDALRRFIEATDVAYAEVTTAARAEAEPVVRLVHPRHEPGDERELVFGRYPIGRDAHARAELKFAWKSDFGDVSPQSEILLQVAVDVLAKHLSRVQSELAPLIISPAPSARDARLSDAPTALEARPSRP
jgi:UDP-GlcNAc:undecaprenyl-phosphate GlcNAc-1-phosphate transferase